MRRIRSERVSDEELHLVRQYLTGSFVLGFERAPMRIVAVNAEARLPDGHLDQLLADLRAVEAEDVLVCARAVLHPEALCVAAAGPLDESEVRDARPWQAA
ncbi:MAG: hypothetical protein R3F34_10515 [Planctomycetota bacterium]